MTRTTSAAVAMMGVLTLALAASPQAAQAQSGGEVKVTVKYNGKGTVDADHRLWVWLFTTPDIGPGAIPIVEQSLDKNGGVVTFTTTTSPVYIAIAYDEKGGFLGDAPPPPGSPIAVYGASGMDSPPAPVHPGSDGAVTIAFNDMIRMP